MTPVGIMLALVSLPLGDGTLEKVDSRRMEKPLAAPPGRPEWPWILGMDHDPCTHKVSDATASAPDERELARIYASIGDDELARGAVRAAFIAFAEAMRLDSTNSRAKEVVEILCEIHGREDHLRPAMDAMRGGRRAEAMATILALEHRAHRAGVRDPSLAMIVGIDFLAQGDDAEAEPRLEFARQDPRFARDATMLLAEIAARRDDWDRARRLASSMIAPPGVDGPPDQDVLLPPRPKSTLTLTGFAQSGFDTNVELASTQGDKDGFVQVGAAVAYRTADRPRLLRPSLFAEGSAWIQKHFLSTEFDLTTVHAGVGLMIPLLFLDGTFDYTADLLDIGWSSNLVSHGPRAGLLFATAPMAVGASYTPIFLHGLSDDIPSMIFRHVVQADVSVFPARPLAIALRYALVLERPPDVLDRYVEHAPVLSAVYAPTFDLRLSGEIGAGFRRYRPVPDPPDPPPPPDPFAPPAPSIPSMPRRSDRAVDVRVAVEYDVTRPLTCVAFSSLRRVSSNISGLSYLDVSLGLGLRVSVEVF